ncbi:MAG: hypothetical protein N3E45_02650 [Oscillatoriaceae bacterium SKW80]|nr:hypothetical protein [Oscillatoriaceae bacterium SKYG93]MCX8119722.1 hypothetical protein [Oscillatoriaceae bacterium SKW80]MDW8452401.1 hypothetical protein [Oscillatoriaceae cyanobacterium SKYGB_i_bin93]HIK27626.1 hypothetical protein [Oscillatoriaceae cyanobacterium M7585_C2015_266]
MAIISSSNHAIAISRVRLAHSPVGGFCDLRSFLPKYQLCQSKPRIIKAEVTEN